MSIAPFFRELRSAYQAEIDDLTFDSEGQNVLRQRLTQRRKELPFLLQMMELSPEMVAVIFHQGFRFKQVAVMDDLLSRESDELPEWDSLVDAVQLTPLAQDLAKVILQEPLGEWFLTVAAGLEYMFSKPEHAHVTKNEEEDDEDGDTDGEADDRRNELDDEEEEDARAREEAGADWMVEQGFDRKD